jgi:hypothetical protein
VAEARPPHRVLDTLVHNLDEPCYVELDYDGSGNLIRNTVWTSNAMTTKIRETILTYDIGGALTTVVKTQHNAAGNVVETLTKTFAYDGGGVLQNVDITRA